MESRRKGTGRRLRTFGLAVVVALVAPLGGSVDATEEESLPRGERVYGELCSSCHGRYGRGDGPLASDLAIKLPDFTNSAYMAGRSDEQIVAGLTAADAHAPMTIGAVLERDALRDAVAYMRTLAAPGRHASPLAGRDIYNASCWVCHGRAGDGNGPAGADLDPKPRDFTSEAFVIDGREQEIYKIISQGAAKAFHGSPYMVEWSYRLTPQQIRDVIEHLRTFKKPGA